MSSITLLAAAVILLALLMLLFVMVVKPVSYYTCLQTGMVSAAIMFIAGLINMNIRHQHAQIINRMDLPRCVYLLQIYERPEIKERVVKTVARVKVISTSGSQESFGFKVMIYFEKDSQAIRLRPGSVLWADIRFTSIPPPRHPKEFDYRAYLAARNIFKQAFVRSGLWKPSTCFDNPNLKLLAFHLQDNLLRTYKKINLDKTLNSILEALTLGYRNDLDVQTRRAFSQAGVMHVMALSGFNVAIIAFALNYLLIALNLFQSGKVIKTLLIIMVIWSFAFVTGLSPSVTRAAVMITFVLAGKILLRHINTYNILFATAFFLLVLSPSLIADVSFQLSFTAVLGILVFHPVLYRLIHLRNHLADNIWKLFTVSCAAQLSTFPLTLYYFHQFPVYFWLTNLIVVPLASVIIITAGIYLLVSVIAPLALFTGKILAVLLEGLYRTVTVTEILPYALPDNIHISIHQTLVLWILVLSVGLFLIYRKTLFLLIAMMLFSVFQSLDMAHQVKIRNQKVFMVSNMKGASVFNLISGRTCVIWGDSGMINKSKNMQYALSGFWIEHGVADNIKWIQGNGLYPSIENLNAVHCKYPLLGDNYLITCCGKRMFFLTDNRLYRYSASYRLKVDLVIISGNTEPVLREMLKLLNMEMILLDSSVGNEKAFKWRNECLKFQIPCWNVADQGAYLWKCQR
jgi:competence protein ComEC